MVITTKAGPLCQVLMSKTDVKAHTDGNVARNQWALIATETWQLNKLGTGDVPAYAFGCFLPTEPCRELNSSTLQAVSRYKLVSTSAQGAGCAGLCEGNGPLYAAQVILLPAEASLEPISCGIINSFRNIQGLAHTRGQTDRLIRTRCSCSFPEMLELPQRGNAPEIPRRRNI